MAAQLAAAGGTLALAFSTLSSPAQARHPSFRPAQAHRDAPAPRPQRVTLLSERHEGRLRDEASEPQEAQEAPEEPEPEVLDPNSLRGLDALDSEARRARLIAVAWAQASGWGGAQGLEITQRRELGSGALGLLTRSGHADVVRDFLLDETVGAARLWAARALLADGRLQGPGGLTSTESSRLASVLLDDPWTREGEELFGLLPADATRDPILETLSGRVVSPELLSVLASALADQLDETLIQDLEQRLDLAEPALHAQLDAALAHLNSWVNPAPVE